MNSIRRVFLDEKLRRYFVSVPQYTRIIDIGGKKESKRGAFRLPKELESVCIYLNITAKDNPDIVGDAHFLPIKESVFDLVICCEVLEHVRNLEIVAKEIYRILQRNGRGIFSLPFLFPIHMDTHDYQRFTKSKLLDLFKDFSEVAIEHMGSYFSVLGTFCELGISHLRKKRILSKPLMPFQFLAHCMSKLDHFIDGSSNFFSSYTTGYWIEVKK